MVLFLMFSSPSLYCSTAPIPSDNATAIFARDRVQMLIRGDNANSIQISSDQKPQSSRCHFQETSGMDGSVRTCANDLGSWRSPSSPHLTLQDSGSSLYSLTLDHMPVVRLVRPTFSTNEAAVSSRYNHHQNHPHSYHSQLSTDYAVPSLKAARSYPSNTFATFCPS